MTIADPHYLLGVDIGTASSKGVLTTPDGEVVATASRTHTMSMPHPGWFEMDAEALFWREVCDLVRELVGRAGQTPVAGLCVSGLGPCLVVCDEQLRPLRPAILYGIDTRAGDQVQRLTDELGAEQIVARCGNALSSQAIGPKLAWVREQEPQVWARTRRFYSAHSYTVAKLTGAYVLDHHTASQFDPLYDLPAHAWNDAWARRIVGDLALPALAWPCEPVGEIGPDAAAATGLPAGTPVVAGTIDAWAESFSAGVRQPGDTMLMYGSTMFFVQVLDAVMSHPTLWTTSGVDRGSYTLAAGMATSGSITGWLKNLTGDAPFEQLVREAAQAPPGSDGLVLLPYFAGERTPIFDPQARGLIAGLTLSHTRGHLFRAAYEGIGYGIRQILEYLDAAAAHGTGRLVAVGGGTQGGLWTQIVSDITGRDQQVPAQTIGACYGDALLAAIGTGRASEHTDWTRIAHVVRPDARHRDRYDELYQTYTSLYPATREHMHTLATLQAAASRAR